MVETLSTNQWTRLRHELTPPTTLQPTIDAPRTRNPTHHTPRTCVQAPPMDRLALFK